MLRNGNAVWRRGSTAVAQEQGDARAAVTDRPPCASRRALCRGAYQR